MEKLVSIIIPIYNEELYLSECLYSVINQTYSNLEIICVDDGSTDDSLRILREYEEKDKRIRVLTQQNQYAGVARNKGIDNSKGDYLFFLDADDYISEKFIDTMVGLIERDNSDIAICRYKAYDQKNHCDLYPEPMIDKYLNIPKSFDPKDYSDWIFNISGGWAWDKLYRSVFVKDNNIRFQKIRVANDGLFVNTSLVLSHRISFTYEKLITHRINVKTSLENTRYEYWKCGVEMVNAIFKKLLTHGIYGMYQRCFIFFAGSYYIWFLRTMKYEKAFIELYRTIKEEIENLNLLTNYDEYICEEEFNIKKELKYIKEHSDIGYLIYCISRLNDEVDRCHKDLKEASRLIKDYQTKKRWFFDEERFGKNARLLLYGYGEVGQDILRQLKVSNSNQVVGVVDQKEISQDIGVNVYSINQIKEITFDYILITIYKEEIFSQVKENLLAEGIEEKKIAWIF